jgi:hypothetical protein
MGDSTTINTPRKKARLDQTPLSWWVALGLGVGLMVLSVLIWTTRLGSTDPNSEAWVQDIERAQPLLQRLQQGQGLSPESVAQADATSLAPLMHALLDAQRQRQQALLAFQAQVESAGLGVGLTPANLASVVGRAAARQRLGQMQAALDGLERGEGAVQSRLSDAVLRWVSQVPLWADETRRQQVLSAALPARQTMKDFFGIEQAIIHQVRDMLDHLDRVGSRVTLEPGPQPELVFISEAELAPYRATLATLGDLGRREQESLAQAQQVSSEHARRLSEVLLASVRPH